MASNSAFIKDKDEILVFMSFTSLFILFLNQFRAQVRKKDALYWAELETSKLSTTHMYSVPIETTGRDRYFLRKVKNYKPIRPKDKK